MAHFRAIIRGSKGGEASRLGTSNSGIVAEVQSWEGKVVVSGYRHRDADWILIQFKLHSNGAGVVATLYDGPICPASYDLPTPSLPMPKAK